MSFSTDWLFPPFQSEKMVNALIAENKPVSYCNVTSNCGHDAFLLADELPIYGEAMRAFLANLDGGAAPADDTVNDTALDDLSCQDPTSIFHSRRLDYDSIVELVPPGASVLDLGCGNGGLLARLRRRGCTNIMGIELDEKAIVACVRRGLDVVQADLDHGLSPFADGQFDFVVLSQTLQAVMDVERVLKEILRVGRQGDHQLSQYRLLEAPQASRRGGPRPAGWLAVGLPVVQLAQRPLPLHRRLRRLLPRQPHPDPPADRPGYGGGLPGGGRSEFECGYGDRSN